MVDVASGSIGVDAAVDLARRALLATGSSTELKGEMTDLVGDHAAWVLVGEKYFLRNSSYASLTVLVSGDAQSSRVQALGSGVSDGIINIGFGAVASFEGDFERLLVELGYN